MVGLTSLFSPNLIHLSLLRRQVISSLRSDDRKLNYCRRIPAGKARVPSRIPAILDGISKAGYASIKPYRSPLLFRWTSMLLHATYMYFRILVLTTSADTLCLCHNFTSLFFSPFYPPAEKWQFNFTFTRTCTSDLCRFWWQTVQSVYASMRPIHTGGYA